MLTVIAARIGLSTVAGLLIWAHAPALVLGWHATVVLGDSMRPQLRPGDVVAYQPLKGRAPKSGQVVVVIDPARPSRLLIHRVGKVLHNGNLITAGDNNKTVDSTPVPPEDILGIGRLRIPRLGLPAALWRDRDHALAVLSLLGLAVVTRLAILNPVGREERQPEDRPDGDNPPRTTEGVAPGEPRG